MKWLLFLLLCSLSLSLPAQTTAIKENLGASINTAEDQILPVFSLDGKTLYFSQNGANDQYEIWISQQDENGHWKAKQRANDLNPSTSGSKYVFAQAAEDLLLVNGWFEQTEEGWIQTTGLSWFVPSEKQFLSINIPTLQRQAKGRFVNAFLHRPSKTLLLSYAENEGKNIYICRPENPSATWTDLRWQQPQRLPAPLNSEFDDTTPFLDGKTLYFASNRSGGYGGTDIYSSRRLDDSWMNWSEPENLGFGVNSNFSEIYYSISPARDYTYFVSYKYSYGSGDIFRLQNTSEMRSPANLLSPISNDIVTVSPSINTSRLSVISLQPPSREIVSVPVSIGQDVEETELSISEYKANNLLFLIDRSSSMQPFKRLPLLKFSLKQLIAQLRNIDGLTLMSFADSAKMHYSTQGVTEKERIYELIDGLSANGNTKANRGLELAYEYTNENFIKGGNNEIILVTDGEFRLSEQDRKLIEDNSDIILSVIGLGDDKRSLSNLRRLAMRAGGSFIHIQNIKTANQALLEEVKTRSRI